MFKQQNKHFLLLKILFFFNYSDFRNFAPLVAFRVLKKVPCTTDSADSSLLSIKVAGASYLISITLLLCNPREHSVCFISNGFKSLTDSFFETGAYGVPSKLQNPSVLGQGGPSSANVHTLFSATPHFNTVHKTKFLFSHWIFVSKRLKGSAEGQNVQNTCLA